MKVTDLSAAIENLKQTHPRWQSEAARAAIGAVIRLLSTQGDITIEEFCARVERALAKNVGRAKVAKIGKPLNELGVARYVDELNGAREDNTTFEAIMRRLEKDRSILLAEALEIASRFTGRKPSGGTKAAAFNAILDRQIADKRSKQRIRQVPGLF